MILKFSFNMSINSSFLFLIASKDKQLLVNTIKELWLKFDKEFNFWAELLNSSPTFLHHLNMNTS